MKCHDESNIALTLLQAEGLNVNQLDCEALSDVCSGPIVLIKSFLWANEISQVHRRALEILAGGTVGKLKYHCMTP
jgi:hypothetical protein